MMQLNFSDIAESQNVILTRPLNILLNFTRWYLVQARILINLDFGWKQCKRNQQNVGK